MRRLREGRGGARDWRRRRPATQSPPTISMRATSGALERGAAGKRGQQQRNCGDGDGGDEHWRHWDMAVPAAKGRERGQANQRTAARTSAASTTTSSAACRSIQETSDAEHARNGLQAAPDGQIDAVDIGPAEELMPVLEEDAGEVARGEAVPGRREVRHR